MKFPQPAHRLDKPTSGLLLIAKTKPAIVNLSKQFEQRVVKKSYTAIVNGIPELNSTKSISGAEAKQLGAYIESKEEMDATWEYIDFDLEGKSSITMWRPINSTKSLKAMNQTLSTLDLKLKTGRKHQLRRHLAWVLRRPIVGDKAYDEEADFACNLQGRGLFLCSKKVKFLHPYFNSDIGRAEFNKLAFDHERNEVAISEHVFLDDADDLVYVKASIPLPQKFSSFLERENERYYKFQT